MRKSKKPVVERLRYIDVRDLSKAGALEGPWLNFGAPFRYDFLRRLETSRHQVRMTMKNCVVPVAFRLEWTRCNYGGRRPWFRCPSCGRRVAKIYGGGIFLGCRHCYEGRYECQRRGEKSRAYYQACKIRLSLGGEPSIRGPFPERPRGMWRRTYERLRRQAEESEAPLRESRYAKRAPDYEQFSFS
jgi:hypothetical protein